MRNLQPPEPLTQFNIRRMRIDDLPEVSAIEQVAFRNPWSIELLRRELSHEVSTILLAEETSQDGQRALLGFSIFWLVHRELHILNIATAPAHRRRGVANALLAATLKQAKEGGCVLATLEVRRSNDAALGLYRGFGFRAVGIRPNYYSEEGEDAIVMVLDL